MRVIIELDVPEWQIGKQVEVFFPDTMMKKGVCELLKEQDNCENCSIAIEDRQPIVRCKDCKHRGDRNKCIVAFVAEKQEMPYFFYDNRGEWFCADGKRKDT